MPIPRRYRHGQWPNELCFMLAAAGACIGLGNLWRFPALAMEYGGGAFVLAYVSALALLGLPVALAEIVLGRGARHDPVGAFREAAVSHGRSRHWAVGGWLAVVAASLLLVLIAISTGWASGYLFRSVTGALFQLDLVNATALFNALSMDLERTMFWVTVFLALVVMVVAQGLQRGILPAVLMMVPLLLVTLLVLFVGAVSRPNADAALRAVLVPDWAALGRAGVLAAFHHAYSTLALGVGVMIAYGAALPARASAVRSVTGVLVLDLAAALVATVLLAAIAPGPATGPQLAFEVLPTVFSALIGGETLALAFYGSLLLAGLTTGIALMESVVSALSGHSGMRRGRTAVLVGMVVWLLCLVLVLLETSPWTIYGDLGTGIRQLMDIALGRVLPLLLTLAGLCALVLVGWRIAPETVRRGLAMEDHPWAFIFWQTIIRWLAPVLLLVVGAYTITGLQL